jgi:hypothetical protein
LYYTEFEKSFYGCWLKDGSPLDDVAAAKVWLTREIKPDLLVEYENVDALRKRTPLVTHTLKRKFTGNGHAVYAGYFYYNQVGGNWLVKYKLNDRHSQTTDQVIQLYPTAQSAAVPLPVIVGSTPSIVTSNTSGPFVQSVADVTLATENDRKDTANLSDASSTTADQISKFGMPVLPLYKAGHNLMDILTDEHGLWIVYAWPQTNDTLVLKLDTNRDGVPRIANAFEITLQRDYFGQAFISCGVLYLVDSVREIRTKIELAVDLFNRTKVALFDSNDEILDDLSLMSNWPNSTDTAPRPSWKSESVYDTNDSYDSFETLSESALANHSDTPLTSISTSLPIDEQSAANRTVSDLQSKLNELADKRQQLKMLKREGIEFINPFRNNKQISYNPTSNKLYAWDQNALIEYALLFNF